MNELASAVVGFMIYGDAMVTEKLHLPAPAGDLLLEIQGSLDQLSGSSTPSQRVCVRQQSGQSEAQVPAEDIKQDAASLWTVAPPSLVLSVGRHRSPAQRDSQQQQQQQHAVDQSSCESTSMSPSDSTQLFQPPDLPGMQQTNATESQSDSADSLLPPHVWAGTQPELLSQVLQQMSWTSKEAVALTGVCR